MKSASLIVDPSQTYESLKDLGSRLQPAPGWKFRAVLLDHDLVPHPDGEAVKITQDELGNTHDRVGGQQQPQAVSCVTPGHAESGGDGPGAAAGGYTGAFELICRQCGDHPYLDYSEIPRGCGRSAGRTRWRQA